MSEVSFHVGWCPFCDQSWIDIVKDSDGTLFLLCEECDTNWSEPENIQADKPNMDVVSLPVRAYKATLEEIDAKGWSKWVL